MRRVVKKRRERPQVEASTSAIFQFAQREIFCLRNIKVLDNFKGVDELRTCYCVGGWERDTRETKVISTSRRS